MNWANKKEVIRELKINGEALKYASSVLQDDKEIVLEAVKNAPLSITYASTKLKDDEDILQVVLKANPFAIIYFSQRLKEKFREESIKQSRNYNIDELKYKKRQLKKKLEEISNELDDITISIYKTKLQEITKNIEMENKHE